MANITGQWRRNGRGGRGGRGGWSQGRGRRGGRRSNSGPGARFERNSGRRGPLSSYNITNDSIEEIGVASETSLTIAIEGCCHGELDRIYDRLQKHEESTGQKVDLLLCCGDFQSHRNASDFYSSSIAPKYRTLGTFPKYYAGEKSAPILTIFIGGNHEASQPLQELYYGGWVAPNIYFMGAAGIVRFGGLRIGGLSGIYKSHDYKFGHFGEMNLEGGKFCVVLHFLTFMPDFFIRVKEHPPLDQASLRSIYHVRNIDVYRLKQLGNTKSRVDIMLSHDWPLGIEQFGDTQDLLRRKPFFREEVNQNSLGSPPNREILDAVKPKWWFSAHLHVKFKALVKHELNRDHSYDQATGLIPSQVITSSIKRPPETKEESSATSENPENDSVVPTSQREIPRDGNHSTTEFRSVESVARCNSAPDLTDQMTRFLALDKCLPRREYLTILHIPSEVSKKQAQLEYDEEWLAIVRKTHHLSIAEKREVEVPLTSIELSPSEIEWVHEKILTSNADSGLAIPKNFVPTVPYYTHPMFQGRTKPLARMGNPQTDQLLRILELEHAITVPYTLDQSETVVPLHLRQVPCVDTNEIQLDSNMNDDANTYDRKDSNELDIEDDADFDKNEIEIPIDGETNGDSNEEAEGVSSSRDKEVRDTASIVSFDNANDIHGLMRSSLAVNHDNSLVKDGLPQKKARTDEP